MKTITSLTGLLVVALSASAWGQATPRDVKVRADREAYGKDAGWIYNDLVSAVSEARKTGKPLLVVFRCIPCEACQEFDDDVAARHQAVRDLMDRYVGVRIVQANALDLTKFQFDFDLSFSAVLMHADGTILGRYGTRSDRPESEDIDLKGFGEALEKGLALHKAIDEPGVRDSLKGKQVDPSRARFRTPLESPFLAGRYSEKLDYEGAVAKSCVHCHQVREAERHFYRSKGGAIPDDVLFAYPDPSVLGLKLDPKSGTTVAAVEPKSAAGKAGLKAGDELRALGGQPLLSTADLQWILHNAPSAAKLDAKVRRDDRIFTTTFDLPEGWKRVGNLSWRPTSWDLRRMGAGGMRLDPLTASERSALGLDEKALGLRIKHVGLYGEHATAHKAGIQKDDILVGFDGRDRAMTESQVFAYALQEKKPGDTVEVVVLRDGQRKTFRIALQ